MEIDSLIKEEKKWFFGKPMNALIAHALVNLMLKPSLTDERP